MNNDAAAIGGATRLTRLPGACCSRETNALVQELEGNVEAE